MSRELKKNVNLATLISFVLIFEAGIVIGGSSVTGQDRMSYERSDFSGTEDPYIAEASSPLSTIIQTLLGRPIVITATTRNPDQERPSSSSYQSYPYDDSIQHSASSPSDATVAQSNSFYHSSSHPSSYRASSPYKTKHSNDNEDSGQISQIYIGRPGAIAKLFKDSGVSSQKSASKINNVVWRDYRQFDGRSYPSASFNHHSKQQESPVEDDQQTVSFGLSFGGRPVDDTDSAEQVDPENSYLPSHSSSDNHKFYHLLG